MGGDPLAPLANENFKAIEASLKFGDCSVVAKSERGFEGMITNFRREPASTPLETLQLIVSMHFS